jgi:hypothetical protein
LSVFKLEPKAYKAYGIGLGDLGQKKGGVEGLDLLVDPGPRISA